MEAHERLSLLNVVDLMISGNDKEIAAILKELVNKRRQGKEVMETKALHR